MGLLSFLGALSPAHINLFTLMSRGKMVGTDPMGNRYYQAAPRKGGYKLARRWVMYKGTPEASAVPAEWHGWLHHQTDVVPSEEGESFRQSWQKPHKANMTGTNQAYFPPGYTGPREKATGDYEAWVPDAPVAKAVRAPVKKKAAAKTKAVKAAVRKPAVKTAAKSAPKNATPKTVKNAKPAPKKAVSKAKPKAEVKAKTKTATAKKAAPKKAATKKSAPKKTAAKKSTAKKTSGKKAAAKK